MNPRHAFRRRAMPALRWIPSLLLSAALLFPAPPARSQGPSGASPVLSVQVTGSSPFTSQQIPPSTGLQTGASATREDIQAGADRLAKLGAFFSVQYLYSAVGAGIKVEYQVTDAPEIPASFDNFPWLSDEDLIAGIKSAVPLFDGKVPVQGGILDEISAAIQKLLDSKGLHVRVSHVLSVGGVGDQQVQLFTAEGDQLNVASIQFSDALAGGDRMIEDRASDLLGKPFSRSAIEIFELEQVRPIYLSHGYLGVRFGPPSSRMAGD